jgi:hypothetical protein
VRSSSACYWLHFAPVIVFTCPVLMCTALRGLKCTAGCCGHSCTGGQQVSICHVLPWGEMHGGTAGLNLPCTARGRDTWGGTGSQSDVYCSGKRCMRGQRVSICHVLLGGEMHGGAAGLNLPYTALEIDACAGSSASFCVACFLLQETASAFPAWNTRKTSGLGKAGLRFLQ